MTVKYSAITTVLAIILFSSVGASALSDGLTSHWRFDSDQAMIEDYSGENNDLRFDSNAVYFDGVDDYADIEHYDDLNLSYENGFALSVRFKVRNFTENDIVMESMGHNDYDRAGDLSPAYDSHLEIEGDKICGDCERGFTVARTDKNWSLIETKEFDTFSGSNSNHGSACNAAGNMTEYLESIPERSKVAMVTRDAPQPANNCDNDSVMENWKQTLSDYGANSSTVSNNTEYEGSEDHRSSFLLIGEKGLGDSNAYYYKHMPRYGTALYFESGQIARIGRQISLRAFDGSLEASADKNSVETGIEEGRWYDATVQFTSDNRTELWVDGEKVGETDVNPSDNLIFGSLNDMVVGGPFLKADVGEVAVFDRELSEGEIENISQRNSVESGRVAGLEMLSSGDILENTEGTDAEWRSSRTKAVYSFDEADIQTLEDSSREPYNFNFSGRKDGTIDGANWSSGVSGEALDFDGDHVDIDTVELEPGAQKTVSLWINTDSWGSYRGGTGMMRDDLSENDYNGYLHMWNGSGGDRFLRVEDYDGRSYSSDDYDFNLNEWHHLGVVFDTDEIRFYGDGQYIGSEGEGLQSPLNFSAIGAGYGDTQYHDGKIDEVKIYDRTLTDKEMENLGRLGRPEKDLVREWNFDEGSGDTVFDTSFRRNGAHEKGIRFNGSQQYGQTDSFPLGQSNDSAFSFSFWVNSENGGNIIGKSRDAFDTGSGDENLLLQQAAGTIRWKLEFNGSNDEDNLGGSTSVDDGEWHHVVGVRDNWTFRIYVDGELDAEYEKEDYYVDDGYREYNYALNSDQPLDIGHYRQSNFFQGMIDEVLIEDRALGETEVEKIYREQKVEFPSHSVKTDLRNISGEEGLLGSPGYRFEGETGATVDNLFYPHNGFTVSTWVKNNEAWGENRKEIWTSGPSEAVIRAEDRYGWGAGGAIFHWNDGDDWYGIKSRNLTKGRWYHLAGVYNASSGEYSFYLDGREQTQTAPSSPPIQQSGKLRGTTTKQYIGRHQDGANNWNGNIDETRVYDRPLNRGEIRRLAFR